MDLGMAKPGPDTDARGENAAGFVSDHSYIIGFSHLHDSGTGGAPSLGNFPLFVHPGCPGDSYLNCTFSTLGRSVRRTENSAQARPGYFAIGLENTVRAEMTATQHAALYSFSFVPEQTVSSPNPGGPATNEPVEIPTNPLILIDIQDLGKTRTSGGVRVEESGRIVGHGTFGPSFGVGKYQAYVCADFRGAEIRASGIFEGDHPREGTKQLEDMRQSSAGAWLHFDHPAQDRILARVGLSFISIDQACANAEAEIPDFDFDRVGHAAAAIWAEKLSVVEVDDHSGSDELQTVFWSGLYRTLLSPQNYTGENPLWKSSEPYFDSFYCIWDSFRAQHPLLTIIDPEAQAQMVRALLDIYRFEGKLPDCRMSFCKGYTQGGSNADVVIADAFLKNVSNGVDWNTAYEAVLSDAEVSPKSFNVEGRGNIESWLDLGYIASDHRDRNSTGPHSRSVSRTVEYAYNDFCIATLAKGLGYSADYQRFMRRSVNWQNLWNHDQRDLLLLWDRPGREREATSFVGFLQPRRMDGTFGYQNTRVCSPGAEPHICYYDTSQSTYEGSPWLYSFYAPQDMATLVRLVGGPAALADRLDYFHESGLAYMGNEQSFLTVFQFHYAARPGRSSYWVRRYIPSQFNTTVAGIPGNDDCAMGAFTAFAAMGLFPVAGQDVYLITAPLFRELRLPSRRGPESPAIIRKVAAPGQGRVGDDGMMYVQSAKLNGQPYTKSWITHHLLMEGGVLELTIGREETDWGTAEQDLPPSYPFTSHFREMH
ncbi:glycoside hydrolase family 92 protein [Sodiomyces alkalinus F11]|uniref:Glycoside hydrolase family 92 protein n=1 Tax=Sodiomyces alkalinus (strain CBS 110278 / VKM F-3762 / F11) TaxID=1314773 RepID=A0A3N2PQE8_SODAK|nr:glycoside hydrolase family 92 protein [Sodiomyces alkalinus F11]ROT36660.1 glycoside hydrolase family 92 protein [Sodiomyces alkalinus F11]